MLPNPNAKNFTESLRSARKAANMTQKELSLAAGFFEGMVGLYERRVHVPEPDSWLKLNKILFPGSELVAPSSEVMDEFEDAVTLTEATVEELLEELKRRGFAKVTLGTA
ncbi:helix-turn-helix domain-containing protein [Pseudomonas sp. D3-10]|uniref:helix-turn-helix domain-containing protein n=1 Tax=Pseudomonas sp. D3-10 TaxID=2817392 RepID=UPI003DA8A682